MGTDLPYSLVLVGRVGAGQVTGPPGALEEVLSRPCPDVHHPLSFVALPLQVALVGLEALGAEELLALGAPELTGFLAVVTEQVNSINDLLVDLEPGLQAGEEQVVCVRDAAGLRDGCPAHGALPNGLVLAQATEAQGVEAGEKLEVG